MNLPGLSRFCECKEKPSQFCKAFAVVVIFVAAALAYQPIWNGGFVWDDNYLVKDNPLIRSPLFALEVFRHFLFVESTTHFYRPVQNLAYQFDYWRAGFDAAAYHRTNLAIHACNGVLLFFFAERILRFFQIRANLAMAFLLALIWVLHPVHSAIPAYIAGRADSLALGFFLLGWLAWEKGQEQKHRWGKWLFYSGALFASFLSISSKEIALTGLLLFVLHLWILRRELPIRSRICITGSVLLIFSIYLLLRLTIEGNQQPAEVVGFPLRQRLEMCLRAQGDYFRLLFYPSRLFMERQIFAGKFLMIDPASLDPLFQWLGWMGAGFIAFFIGGLFWNKPGRGLRIFGFLWYLVMILPVSNLLALNASVAEHWLYIPSIGFLFFLVGCWEGLGFRGGKIITVCCAMVAMAITALGVRTWFRANEWKDEMTFLTSTQKQGGDSPRIRMNLAASYRKQGRLDEAASLYRSILAFTPEAQWVKLMLAQVLQEQGHTEKSASLMQEIPVAKSDGDLSERILFINQLVSEKRLDEALKLSLDMNEKQPTVWPLVQSIAKILHEQGKPEAAVQVVRDYANKYWWHLPSRQLLGRWLADYHKLDAAILVWLEASRLDIRDPQMLNLAAAAQTDLGRFDEAIRLQKKAITRQDTSPQWNLLSLIYRAKKDSVGEQNALVEGHKRLLP